MDPVSHGVLGRAVVAAAGLNPQARGIGAAAVLGALSPDIDLVLMPFGWDIYLRAHVAGTHAIAGAVVTGLGSAVLIRLCVRDSALPHLCRAGVIGALTHLVCDIVSGAQVQPAWPLSTQTVSLPLVAMGDPWTIGIVVAGAWAMWTYRQRPARTARLAVLALTLFLVAKAALLVSVLNTAGEGTGLAGSNRIVEARWASLTEWLVFDRRNNQLRQRLISVSSPEPLLLLAIQVPAGNELTEKSKSLESVRNFLAVHQLAFPVERTESTGHRSVSWSDIRFCWQAGDEPPPSCALWFGGMFDAAGQAVEQQIRVGAWTQRRRP